MTTNDFLQSTYGVSTYDINNFFWEYIAYYPNEMYQACKILGINNDMLADILNEGYYGVSYGYFTGEDIEWYFDNYSSYWGSELGSQYDDFLWNPNISSFERVDDVGDYQYNASTLYLDYYDQAEAYGYTGSADAYTFVTTDWGTLNIDLTYLEEDLDIFLYNSYGVQLASSTNSYTYNDSIDYSCSYGEELTVIVKDGTGSADSTYMLDIYIA